MGKNGNDDKSVALGLISARINQLNKKLEEFAEKCFETKDKFEGLTELIEELEKSGSDKKRIESCKKRAQQRFQENQDYVRQYNSTKNKIEELEELLAIMEGEE